MLPAWRTWLDDERAVRVRRTLSLVGDGLLALTPQQTLPWLGVTAGLSGVALAHAYLARAGFGDAHMERCEERLAESIERLSELAGDCSLARGVPGFAFVLEHLGVNEDEDQCAELDAMVAAELREREDIPAELMWGMAGRLVYARERLHRPSGRALHEAIVERLLATARQQPNDGLAWFMEPDPGFVGPGIVSSFPEGGYNLGVAHGSPGVIAILAGAADLRAQAAARAGMRWLWAERSPSGPAVFPIMSGGPPYETHGWCYGDEGIGAVLYVAAHALADEEWKGRWLDVLRRAAGRTPTATRGLGLCHGTAGLAQLWNRVFQMTGDPQFRDAALAWLDATLDDVALVDAQGPGLLEGVAGVALALAAFVSDVEPAWDRLFALSARNP